MRRDRLGPEAADRDHHCHVCGYGFESGAIGADPRAHKLSKNYPAVYLPLAETLLVSPMLPICSQCRAPVSDPASPCELCQAPLCRKCRIFLSDEEFAPAGERPPELLHSYYCGACHDEHVIPFQERYQETLEQAKQ